jgi:hypothetical protein
MTTQSQIDEMNASVDVPLNDRQIAELDAAVEPKKKRKSRAKKAAPVVEEPVVDDSDNSGDDSVDGDDDSDDENTVNDLLAAAGENKPLVEVVKEVKRRKASNRERDDSGKVVRKGRNLSGNSPFRHKYYYFDLDAKKTEGYEQAFQAAPGQVRLMMKYMEQNGITTTDDAEIGAEIAGGAINSGMLQSTIDPAALFAYYRRVMERLGLRQSIAE